MRNTNTKITASRIVLNVGVQSRDTWSSSPPIQGRGAVVNDLRRGSVVAGTGCWLPEHEGGDAVESGTDNRDDKDSDRESERVDPPSFVEGDYGVDSGNGHHEAHPPGSVLLIAQVVEEASA